MRSRLSLSLCSTALLFAPTLGLVGTAHAQDVDNLVITGLPDVVGFEAEPLEFTVGVSGVGEAAGTLTFNPIDLDTPIDQLFIEVEVAPADWERIDFSEGAASIPIEDGEHSMRVSYRSSEEDVAASGESLRGSGGSGAADGAVGTLSGVLADTCGEVTEVPLEVTLEAAENELDTENVVIGLGHPSAILTGFPVTLVAGHPAPHEFTVTPCNDTDSDYPEIFLDVFIDADPSGEEEDARLRPEDVVIEWLDDSDEWVTLETEGFGDVIVVTLDAVGPYELLARSTGESAKFRVSFEESARPDTVFLSSGLFAPVGEDLIFVGESPFAEITIVAGPTTPPPGHGAPAPGPSLPKTGAGNSLTIGLIGLVLITAGGAALVVARKRATRSAE